MQMLSASPLLFSSPEREHHRSLSQGSPGNNEIIATPTRSSRTTISTRRRSASIDKTLSSASKRTRLSFTNDPNTENDHPRRPAQRYKSLSQIEAEEHETVLPTTKDSVLDVLFSNSGNSNVGSQIEKARAAMLWRLTETKHEISKLEAELAKLEEEDDGSDLDSVTVDSALVDRLLKSNDAVLSGTTLVNVSAVVNEELPHMPKPALDLKSLRQFTGLEITSLDTALEYLQVDDEQEADGSVLLRTASHTVYVAHPASSVSFSMTLVVNQTDLEVISFALSADTVKPGWAREPISRWADKFTNEEEDTLQSFDISCFLFGVSDLVRVMQVRAEVFIKLCRTFPELINRSEFHQMQKSLQDITNADIPEDSDEDDQDEINKPVAKSELTAWLGEQCLIVRLQDETPSLQLILSWDINLDDVTGDASSKVVARVSAPRYCMLLL